MQFKQIKWHSDRSISEERHTVSLVIDSDDTYDHIICIYIYKVHIDVVSPL